MKLTTKLVGLAFLILISRNFSEAATVVDFEELPVNARGFYNGARSAGPPLRDNYTTIGTAVNFGEQQFLQEWTSGGLSFNNNTTPAFGDSWTGWSWSNVVDNSTPGFGNQYASFPGGGASLTGATEPGGRYAVGSGSGYWNVGDNLIVESLLFTNTTYTALAARDGNDGSGFVSGPFGSQQGSLDPNGNDYLRVTFTGHSGLGATGTEIGSVTRYLADYRQDKSDNPDASLFNNADYVLDEWIEADLSGLAGSRSIRFAIDGSDVGPFGLNTPAGLAIDNVSITAIPEPGSVAFLAAAGVGLLLRRRIRTERGKPVCRPSE